MYLNLLAIVAQELQAFEDLLAAVFDVVQRTLLNVDERFIVGSTPVWTFGKVIKTGAEPVNVWWQTSELPVRDCSMSVSE